MNTITKSVALGLLVCSSNVLGASNLIGTWTPVTTATAGDATSCCFINGNLKFEANTDTALKATGTQATGGQCQTNSLSGAAIPTAVTVATTDANTGTISQTISGTSVTGKFTVAGNALAYSPDTTTGATTLACIQAFTRSSSGAIATIMTPIVAGVAMVSVIFA